MLDVEGIVDAEFPPAHAASYVLDLTGFDDDRWTITRRLGLTSADMLPTALLVGTSADARA